MLLNGKKIAKENKERLKKKIKKLKNKPGLATILIGKNSSSLIYVRLKEKMAKEIGINFKKILLSGKTAQKEIINLIERLNKNKKINGIIVQLPLPKKFNTNKIIQKISPNKDVDGFHPKTKFVSPAHQAILRLLKQTKISLRNKKAAIFVKNKAFAQPLKNLLEKRGIKTEIVYFKEKNYIKKIKKADILIVALGKPKFVKPKMIKKNSIVIDVGYSRIKGKPIGDVDKKCYKKAKFISPVPGGVGPLTVVYLMKNVIRASKLQ